MTDDKDDEVADPWAGLEAAGEGEPQDDFAFSFEGLEVEAAVAPEAIPSKAAADDGAEAVVEDDIAGWLNEPAAAAPSRDADADTEFVAALFVEPAAEEAAAFAAPEETVGRQDVVPVAETEEEISFPMVSQSASEEVAELEEVAETLFADDEAAAEPAAVLAMDESAVAAPSTKRPTLTPKKKSAGGAVGPIIGGLLSLPIVFFILLGILWGTGRDPIGMRSWLPSFMLPARQGGRVVAAVADTAPPSLDDLASQEPASGVSDAAREPEDSAIVESDAAETAVSEPALPTSENALDSVAMVHGSSTPVIEPPPVEPVEAARPQPPELDLSGIEARVEAALASMDRVSADQSGDPVDRRRALVAWYQDLARVGAELAMVETAAADSGHPLHETPGSVMALYGRLGSAGRLSPDLKRLCRNWVDYTKRPADGVLLVGVLEAARQVGPFWYSTLSLELVDGSLRPVSLISRRAPRADQGDRVAVAGVVFSEDMVWAADCGRLDAAATVEDDPF